MGLGGPRIRCAGGMNFSHRVRGGGPFSEHQAHASPHSLLGGGHSTGQHPLTGCTQAHTQPAASCVRQLAQSHAGPTTPTHTHCCTRMRLMMSLPSRPARWCIWCGRPSLTQQQPHPHSTHNSASHAHTPTAAPHTHAHAGLERLQTQYVRYKRFTEAMVTQTGWDKATSIRQHELMGGAAAHCEHPALFSPCMPDGVNMRIVEAPAEFAMPVKQDR